MIFYHNREQITGLTLNGTVASQSCSIEKDCEGKSICIYSGSVVLNFTYNGTEYLRRTSVVPCCIQYNCCQTLVDTQQPIWVALGQNGTDPEDIITFACIPEYYTYTYYYLCILSFVIFVISIVVAGVYWLNLLDVERKPLLAINNA
jgi:hypothetical protein